MPKSDICCVHLPYCVQRQDDGRYVVLNRDYKPLGFTSSNWIDYSEYPVAVRFKGLTAKTAAKISYKGSEELSSIYLYNDGCIPTASKPDMAAYLGRLAHLAKLKIVRPKD